MALVDNVRRYYQERSPVYDDTAGYTDPEADRLRAPIKARYREMFAGHTVLEIACGTAYWTPAVAQAATAVCAVDIHDSLLSQARQRCKHLSNVAFRIADAYTLVGVPEGFSAAFAIWWWSHVPKERLEGFLATLHRKLLPGALVLFTDELRYDCFERRRDDSGNTLERRTLPEGRVFEIVKNFPSGQEIRNVLKEVACNLEFTVRPEEKSWSVTYNTK